MRTSRPVSTISYNTEPFLLEQLERLYNAHKIQAWQYIKHKGENGDKDHIHLRIEPNTTIDTMDVQTLLLEYPHGDTTGKPLACRPFRYAKEEDWFLYAYHDPQYLRQKGGSEDGGKIPYDYHDIQVSPFYDLEVAIIRAKASLENSAPNLLARFERGESGLEMIRTGASASSVNTLEYIMERDILPIVIRERDDYQNKAAGLETEMRDLLAALSACGISVDKDQKGNFHIKTAPFGGQGGDCIEQTFEDCPF